MKHPGEETLVLFHYEGDRAVARHLPECEPCRARLAELRRLLAAVETAAVPDRDEAYARAVWRRIAPSLTERPEPAGIRFFTLPRLSLAAGMAALVLVAFFVGRSGARREERISQRAARERILMVALAEHLDRSQAVLLELAHPPGVLEAAAPRSRLRAEDLVAANRLLRQAANLEGERGVSDVLENLERVLLEAAHGAAGSASTSAALASQAEGALFEVRVLDSRIQLRERRGARPSHESERNRT